MEWRWQAAGGWCRLLLLVRSMGSFRHIVKVAKLGALGRFGGAALFTASADGRFVTGRVTGIKAAIAVFVGRVNPDSSPHYFYALLICITAVVRARGARAC